ncbi:hypothetical protein HD554DRAFT_2138517, partial [Boletus coccyginus]
MTDEAQHHIDSEMNKHISSLRALRFQRNTLSSTSCLPSEVLAEIFVQGARDHHEQCFPPMGVPTWVNVSYVCHQWRNIALDCPTLWSYLFLESQQWTEALLTRSKQTPLYISVTIGDPEDDLLYLLTKKVANHAERIQELHLYLEGDPEECLDSFRQPRLRVPHLQVLKIQSHLPSFVGEILFNGETPSLRKLDLIYAETPWHSYRLSNLKSLSVRHHDHFQPTMVEFLSTLGCMRDLVDLHLHDALPSFHSLSNVDLNAFQGIDLLHLSRLWIGASPSTVVTFLSCVNTPPNTEMRVHCKNEGITSPNDYSQLSLLLAQKLRSSEDETPSVPTVRTFGVGFGCDVNTFVFSASERDFGRSIDKNTTLWGCNIPLQLSIEFRITLKVNMLGISSDICRNVCPKDVQSVYIHGLLSPSNFWESALGHFQDLRFLRVTASQTLDLA